MTRSVVVSGGGTGIGLATAGWFADRGDDVVIVGRRPEPLESAAGRLGVRWVCADLSTADGARLVADRMEGVDVVVANAGSRSELPGATLEDIATRYATEYRSNVLTAVLLVAALLPKLRRPGGRIVGVGSISAHRGTADAYSAAKAALQGWIFSLARELGPEGITANLVVPGYVDGTEFMQRPPQWHADAERALLRRPGSTAEVAAVIGFVASDEASFMTAQILGVNGGMVLGR